MLKERKHHKKLYKERKAIWIFSYQKRQCEITQDTYDTTAQQTSNIRNKLSLRTKGKAPSSRDVTASQKMKAEGMGERTD